MIIRMYQKDLLNNIKKKSVYDCATYCNIWINLI